jgi:glyoxylase-like metal-dependent hydrolase (beta-lactamase superfamily II)
MAMKEIGPGIHHWTAVHPRIQVEVSSYYVEPAVTLVDPLLPAEGIEWFRSRRAPERVVLTNRHHYRDSDRFQAEFGCTVLASEPGLQEFADGREVEGFAFGDKLTEGITVHEVGSICPDETALHIELGDGFLCVADGVVNYDGLRFVPDNLIGDDAEAVKEGLRASYRRLLELDFDGLLFAHGNPITGGGKQALREFLGLDHR